MLTLTLVLFTPVIFSADIFLADRQFTEKKYTEAKHTYLASAELGNPHAYYQLANIFYNGLGTDKDPINALLYFYLAAEQKFHNSEELLEKILDAMPHENREAVLVILEQYKDTHGEQRKIDKYFPKLDEGKLHNKFSFDGEETLKTIYHIEDVDLEDFMPGFGDYELEVNDDEEFGDDSIGLMMSTPTTPFLIIDHDIYQDGSIRNTKEVQKFGLYKPLAEQFKLFPLAIPEFNGEPADFASRTYLGAAAFNKFSLLKENENMYQRIISQTRKFKKGTSISDRFNLAMLLLNFPWIEQDKDEAEALLLSLSKQGHSPAMFEYGFKLYREQREIKQAIYWISEASKYGLIRAQYRLAKILASSPWVINDDEKALFWFVSAMEKGDVASRINAIKILFSSNDESLLDYNLAVKYLEPLAELAPNDPQYYYLNALKYKSGEHRNIKLAVENLKKAIQRGQMANWDVSEWQNLLTRITTGTVFVTDFEK